MSCSGKAALNPVQGKVLYKNKPASGALVTFHPKAGSEVTAVRPVGLVEEDGTFHLTTGDADGAPAGEYIVTIIWSEEIAPKRKGGFSMEPTDTQDRLKGAYADRAKSKFHVQIKNGPNQLEPFNLN